MHGLNATRAYQARSADRNLRDQEADVFRRATAALRHAQSAYIGTDEERVQGLENARALTAAFKEATTSALAREILDRALAAAEADECYTALKLARRIIRHEDALLGRSTGPVEEVAQCMA
ncbi:MAG: hypothetical protein EOO38_06530 [Cytophagaceae bacterium]|nr:MAG: hypothetical protein EOO38_06530 [Cytophagaceae bacterium]